MTKRIIEISSGAARLSVAHRQLVIERPEQPAATMPCADIGVLIVDHPQVSYTHLVLITLLNEGAVVVICNERHLPAGLLLPLDAHGLQTERTLAQVGAPEPLKKRLWQACVQAKIRQQAEVLRALTGLDEGLPGLAKRVRSGDPQNLEAQAAQRYWPALLGRDFRRGRAGAPPNNLLNYGYAVLRAAVARALVAAGMMPTLGIHHRNRSNPFCLADDLMEPFRPFVDWRAAKLAGAGAVPEEIGRAEKQALLSLLNERIEMTGADGASWRTPLQLAVHATASSLATAFETGQAALALPRGLPIGPGDGDEDGGAENGRASA